MMEAKFDFNDFLKQWQTMNNMGGMQLMKLMPGMAKASSIQTFEWRGCLRVARSCVCVCLIQTLIQMLKR